MLALFPLLFLLACPALCDPFGDYWYQGKAEITSYDLQQARYGEIHEGHAVLVFVTEDFSRSRHVKLDRPAGDDAVNVLKLNAVRKFTTGIYPYSMMTSVFTPVDILANPRSLKITTSSQEWCGHTFTQLDLDGTEYRARLFSYFESEGDREVRLQGVLPEDEVWTRIRVNPFSMPMGEVRLIPGTMFQRLRHGAWGVQDAEITREETGDGTTQLRVRYTSIDRELRIRYRTEFPHEIELWEETHRSGFGEGAREMTTRAVRQERVRVDYWTKNGLGDAHWREKLGLP